MASFTKCERFEVNCSTLDMLCAETMKTPFKVVMNWNPVEKKPLGSPRKGDWVGYGKTYSTRIEWW